MDTNGQDWRELNLSPHVAAKRHAGYNAATMTQGEFHPYEAFGGEAGIRALVDRFYDLMDTLPEARGIRAMHPPALDGSRDKLFKFLSGYLGGPPLYFEQYGHPRLRMRHIHFPIGQSERDQWMLCMEIAAEEQIPDDGLRTWLLARLAHTADFMRNQEEG